MADFAAAFALTMKAEGRYGNDPQDPGGETYKGIARKMNSKWEGRGIIDTMKMENSFPANLDNNAHLQEKIHDFYKINFWDTIRGDEINNQHIAESIFDFAVNAGPAVSAKLAQITVGVESDNAIDSNITSDEKWETLSRPNDFGFWIVATSQIVNSHYPRKGLLHDELDRPFRRIL